MGNNNLIIQLKSLSYRYPGSAAAAINNLDLRFYRGDRIGLMAPNGSGKTTLFHLIMGLLKPDAGQMEIFGNPVSKEKDFQDIRRRIGFLFQDADDQLFSPTVLEDVAFGPLNLGKSKDDAVDITRRTLSFLGLNDFEDRITFKLSGGEKRLVALATVLAMEPEVLLLDEPTSGLDTQTKEKLKEVLLSLDLSYIVISHEYDFVDAVTENVYTMEEGRILLDEALHIHRHEHIHKLGKQPHKH